MVSCGVSWKGVTRLYFLETKKPRWTLKHTCGILISIFYPILISCTQMETTFFNKMAPPCKQQNLRILTWQRGWARRAFSRAMSGPHHYLTWTYLTTTSGMLFLRRCMKEEEGGPFENEEQLKRRLRWVLNDAIEIEEICKTIKQFRRNCKLLFSQIRNR